MTNTPLKAKQATRNLTQALVNMASRGLSTPCSDLAIRDYWCSDLEMERKQAARWCVEWDCPVLQPCLEAGIANDERWSVYGGRDFAVRGGKKLRRDTAA
jgi:hypothetical protein